MTAHTNHKPLGLASSAILLSITVTMAIGIVWWATVTYDWNLSIFIFVTGLFVISWIATIAVLHFHASQDHADDGHEQIALEMRDLREVLSDLRVDRHAHKAELRLKSVE
jgi:biotin transporter BioY